MISARCTFSHHPRLCYNVLFLRAPPPPPPPSGMKMLPPLPRLSLCLHCVVDEAVKDTVSGQMMRRDKGNDSAQSVSPGRMSVHVCVCVCWLVDSSHCQQPSSLISVCGLSWRKCASGCAVVAATLAPLRWFNVENWLPLYWIRLGAHIVRLQGITRLAASDLASVITPIAGRSSSYQPLGAHSLPHSQPSNTL